MDAEVDCGVVVLVGVWEGGPPPPCNDLEDDAVSVQVGNPVSFVEVVRGGAFPPLVNLPNDEMRRFGSKNPPSMENF